MRHWRASGRWRPISTGGGGEGEASRNESKTDDVVMVREGGKNLRFQISDNIATGVEIKLLERTPVIRGVARFGAEFVGFNGHFPDRPILPGFVQVQVGVELLSLALGNAVEVRGGPGGKFLRAIVPGEDIAVEIAARPAGVSRHDTGVTDGGAAGAVYGCTLSVGAGGVAAAFELVVAQKS